MFEKFTKVLFNCEGLLLMFAGVWLLLMTLFIGMPVVGIYTISANVADWPMEYVRHGVLYAWLVVTIYHGFRVFRHKRSGLLISLTGFLLLFVILFQNPVSLLFSMSDSSPIDWLRLGNMVSFGVIFCIQIMDFLGCCTYLDNILPERISRALNG
jgi:hypothetical protein